MDSEDVTTADELIEETVADASHTVGDRLRAAREAKRLEISHIAAETRIPERHLQSIEEGRFDRLPSRTYAIGFARTYARAVDLPEEEIASEVRAELAEGHVHASAIAGGMEPGDPAKLPSAGLAWFGGFAALVFAVGAVFFYNTYFGAGTGPASLIASEDTSEDAELVEAALASAGGEDTGAAPSPTGQVIFTATGEGAWVRFYEEGGERLFEGFMEDGDAFELPLDAQDPRINTGRPNLLAITIDGQQVPLISEETIVVDGAPVSAAALLARATVPQVTPASTN